MTRPGVTFDRLLSMHTQENHFCQKDVGVWLHFDFKQTDMKQKTVICKLCYKTVHAPDAKTRNLFYHRKKIHNKEYRRITNILDQGSPICSRKGFCCCWFLPQPSRSTSDSTHFLKSAVELTESPPIDLRKWVCSCLVGAKTSRHRDSFWNG